MGRSAEAEAEQSQNHVSKKYKTFQEFLDNEQYSIENIISYEKIFGKTFISPGGLEAVKTVCEKIPFKPGCRVLDVGCGIGGSAFYMVEKFGAHVVGIDLSDNMITVAKQRLQEVGLPNIEFKVADVTTIDIPDESFDVIYSRDTILHIEDKVKLFKNFLSWLKPGGHILITDYCCHAGEWTKEFESYVKSRGYFLLDPQSYGKMIENIGFQNVSAIDNTDLFLQYTRKEFQILEDLKDEIKEGEWSEETYQHRRKGWSDKIQRAEQGIHLWGLFTGQKSLL